MKKGAKRMAYPGSDPENGPAYMQQWTGEKWICYVHKPDYIRETGEVMCKQCGLMIMDKAKVKLTAKRRK